MIGRQLVREWDPVSGNTCTWLETLDQQGVVRIVRPETGGTKFIIYSTREAIMLEPGKTPTFAAVVAALRQLIARDISPEQASDWARPLITKYTEIQFDMDRRTDRKIKQALTALAGADMIVDMEGHPLHGQADFEAWLQELLA
jgi:hypothetical protein